MGSRPDTGSAAFLVECYWPGSSREGAAAAVIRAGWAAREMRRHGRTVRCLHATFIPAEEVLFCVYEAQAVEDVAEVNARARVPATRIVEAAVLSPALRPRTAAS